MADFRRPESVLVIVHSGIQVLLLRRVRPFPFWQSVTGSLEAGEEPMPCALRELREETGIDGSGRLVETGTVREFIIDPRWRNRYAPGVTRNTEYEFRLALDRPVDVQIDASEHSEYRWLPVDDAIELAWSSTNQAALKSLREIP